MNHRYKIIASKDGLLYHFASLEFKLENRELFYIVKVNYKKSFIQYHDFETGKRRIEKNIDHFSFHKDGTVHLVYKNKKNKSKHRDQINIGKNLFDIPDNNYAPLLIHSISFDSELELCPRIDTIDNESLVFIVDGVEKFSVVLFSVGKKVNYKAMLNSHGFDDVFISNKSVFLAEPLLYHPQDSCSEVVDRIKNGIFVDANILLGFTEKTIVVPNKYKPENIFIKSHYVFSLLPSDNKILNLN